MADSFSDLLVVLKREVLADSLAGDIFSDSNDLLPMLFGASSEIAATLGFPQSDVSVAVADGDSSVVLPGDVTAVRIHGVSVGPFDLRLDSPAEVLRKRQFTSGMPAVYSFDPRVGNEIQFGPAFVGSPTTAVVRVTEFINPESLDGSDEPWDGRLREWWWVITLVAAEKAMRAQDDLERAGYYYQRAQVAMTELGQFLGLPPSELGPNLLARPDNASQGGQAWFPAQARGG